MTLQRRTPLRAKPRAKGNRGELAVRDMIRASGWPQATRNWMSGGQGGGDIINGPADVHVECKWCERCSIWEWLKQAEGEARPTDIAAVFLRDNRHQWWVVAEAHEVEALMRLNPVTAYTVVRESKRLRFWDLVDEAETETATLPWRPSVRFSRDDVTWYRGIPASEFLALLRLREAA